MKKIIMAAMFALFSMAAFAGVSKEKAKPIKSKNKTTTSKMVKCNPSTTKIEHNVDCPGWYSVDTVDTVIITCDGNGNLIVNTYHWEQLPDLICS
jgi:hypothetical protein